MTRHDNLYYASYFFLGGEGDRDVSPSSMVTGAML